MIKPLNGKSGRSHSKEEMRQEILRLKQDMNAVILAHYYQESEIQDLADFVGDSLDLSRTRSGDDSGCHCLRRCPFHGGDREDSQSG